MTTENKDLLLKYLCMALPYGVIIEYNNDGCSSTREMGLGSLHDFMYDNAELKPYLRPMSSMTEDELSELSNIISEWWDKELFTLTEEPMIEFALSKLKYSINPMLFNWLLENHFDFIGLIEKNLALDCTGLHIYD